MDVFYLFLSLVSGDKLFQFLSPVAAHSFPAEVRIHASLKTAK